MSESAAALWNPLAYEAVLNVPFNPDYIAPTVTNSEYDIVDVRKFAHDVVMDAVHRFSSRECAGETLFNPHEARHIAAVHELIGSDFSLLRRQVRVADNLAAAQSTLQVEEYQHPPMQARANHQFATINGIIDSLQKLRLPRNETNASLQELLRSGVIAVAPTGFGKTFVGAHVLRAAGIGRYLNGTTGEPLNALVVVPSIDLVHQYTRDDDNIFRQVIGYEVPIGRYWSHDKEIKPVTVMTKRSLSLALERGDVDRGQFGLLLFDEVHHATSPQAFTALQKITSGMVGLTATPAYNERRDVRKWFPHLRTGSLRQFAEDGILSPARLLTFRESETQSTEDIAVSLAIEYVLEGRQAIVYTRKGNNSMQARDIADRINEALGKNTACAIGHFAGAKDRVDPIDAYRNGSLRVLTTSRMLLEGFDGPVDGMITIGPHYSRLDLTQKAGRAMRPGRFEALLAEILPKTDKPDPRMVSLATVFGIDNFVQGMYIGPSHGVPGSNKTATSGFIDELPSGVQTLLVETQKIREIYVGPEMEQQLTGGQILLAELAEMYQTHEKHIEAVLSAAGITGVSVTTKSEQTCEIMTWYGAEAVTYLDENPPPKLPDEAFMSPAEIIELTGVSRTYLSNLRKKYGFELHPRLISKNRTIGFFDKETTATILEIIDDIPFAEIDDVPIGSMSPEIAATFLLTHCEAQGIPIMLKRRNEEHGLKGFASHLSASDAALVRKAHYELAKTDNLVTFNEIARRAEINYSMIKINLMPDELKAVTRRYVQPEDDRRRLAYHLPQDVADQVIERLRRKDLPVGVLSVRGLQQRLKRGSSTVHNYIGALGDGHDPLIGTFRGQPGSRAAYYSWETLAAIEQRVSPPKTALAIDFTRLTKAALAEPHNQLYAQILQSFYMGTIDESRVYSVNEVTAALQCSNKAYATIIARIPGALESAHSNRGEQTLRIAKQALLAIAIIPPPRPGLVSYSRALQWLAARGYSSMQATTALEQIVASKHTMLAEEHGHVDLYLAEHELNRVVVVETKK